MPTTFKFINHACFTLTHEGHTIIFDPYLDGSTQDINDLKVEYIFVSHGHFDHLGSAIELAKACNATIISTAEVCGVVSEAGVENHAMHLGGTHEFPFGKVRLTLAFHGSGIPGGHACGFIVDFYGTKLYFAGDTALFGDMQLLYFHHSAHKKRRIPAALWGKGVQHSHLSVCCDLHRNALSAPCPAGQPLFPGSTGSGKHLPAGNGTSSHDSPAASL